MQLPTIQFDGKLTSVYAGDITLWFSYEQLVAFRVGVEKVVHKNIWSQTTGKHLNLIDSNSKNRVDAVTFAAKWKELTRKGLPQGLLG